VIWTTDDFDNNVAIIAVAMSAAKIDTYRKAYADASTTEERAKALKQHLEWMIVHDRCSRRVQRKRWERSPVRHWWMENGVVIRRPYAVVNLNGI
jgi:hypothetical protein